jgi:4-amino-4-deoxy-L-arabinose transferase-like glycosyltransferase
MVFFSRLFKYLRNSRIPAAFLHVVILAGSAVRVREAFVHNPMNELFSDPLRHWTFARETLSEQPWAIIDPPLFQMWLSLVQKWSMGVPLLVAIYAGALSAVTPWLWYRFLREHLSSRVLALTGWALLAWLPSWVTIFRYFMTETLFLPLLGASLWATLRADRRRTVSSFSGMTALWMLTGMTRGIAIPLGGLAGLWVWARGPHKGRKVAASLAIVFAMTVPLAIRNYNMINLWSPLGTGWPNQIYAVSGAHDIHLDLTRDGGTAYYQFGSPSMYALQLAPLSSWQTKRHGTVKVTADLRKGALDWETAYRNNEVHGRENLRLRLENVILVMLGESWPDNNRDCTFVSVALTIRWIWAPLFVLVLALSAAQYRRTLRRPLLPVMIATWFVFQATLLLVLNEGRYRKPLEGLLVAQLLVLLDTERLFPHKAV